MRRLGLAAVAVLMCTTANAGEVHEFAIGGGKVRIEMRDCQRGTCPWVTWNSKSSGSRPATTRNPSRNEDDDDYRDRGFSKTGRTATDTAKSPAKAETARTAGKSETARGPSKPDHDDDYDDDDDYYANEKPAANGSAAAPPPVRAAVTAAPPPPPPSIAAPAPASKPVERTDDGAARVPASGEPAPAPPMPTENTRASSATMDAPMWKDEPRQRLASRAPEPVDSSRSEPALAPVRAAKLVGPIGEWTTEDGEGRVLVEECGANLCGNVSHARNPNDTDRNNPNAALRKRSVIGMPVLIDMKPKGDRWEGKVYNAKDGKTYTAKLSMRNANTMRIEGCIMNGMLCGGQNWKRAQ